MLYKRIHTFIRVHNFIKTAQTTFVYKLFKKLNMVKHIIVMKNYFDYDHSSVIPKLILLKILKTQH